MANIYPCAMCPFFAENLNMLVSHLVKLHRNAPQFTVHCNVVGCGMTFKNYISFKTHTKRKHGDVFDLAPHDEHLPADDVPADGEHDNCFDDHVDDEEPMDSDLASSYFMLKLKANCNLSQSALQEVRLSTEFLIKQKLEEVKATLLATENLTRANISNIFENTQDSLFDGSGSLFMLKKQWKDRFNFAQPKQVKLGEVYKNRRAKHGSTTSSYHLAKHDIYGYYVPVIDSLQSLLYSPMVRKYVMSHSILDFGKEEMMTDVFDGKYFQTNEYLQEHPEALVFAIYSDDFEVANPIGHHRTVHKLTSFYYVLLNIPPHLRMKLEAVQLIAIAKTADVKKYGHSVILKDFIYTMNRLHSGVRLAISLQPTGDVQYKMFHGMLGCVFGDTPASQLLGGFKEGVGRAYKPCRTCEIVHDELPNNSIVVPSLLREEAEHLDRCDNLETEMTPATRKYWSKVYGITRKAELLDIEEFEVTKCILHDPMHVLLEGLVPMETKLLLTHCVEMKYFTIRKLNDIIKNFEYSTEERRDTPVEINWHNVVGIGKFQQTAQSMKNLLVLLPFMVGMYVPEGNERWLNFIRLLQITMLTFSSVASTCTIDTLKVLIGAHHSAFTKLYPESSVTPKMHYLSHIPEQIKNFGPTRNHSCMRLEAKHGACKDRKYRNFRAVHKTISFQHQEKMCLRQLNADGSPALTYLSEDDDVIGGNTIDISEEDFYNDMIQREYGEVDRPDVPALALNANGVKSRGHCYAPGTVLLKAWNHLQHPEFLKIKEIIVFNNSTYFVCECLETVGFKSHLNAFKVDSANAMTTSTIKPSHDLKYYWPQIVHMYNRSRHVMLQNVDDAWQL